MTMRDLRALRYDPPGHAKQGARRTTFQSALEQCEQFLAAACDAGYATRPVQLFYALSQAGRAIVAASPRIGNQAWRVNGHGLSANTNAQSAPAVTVTANRTGLFPSVAAALGVEPLAAGEPIALRELWPLLPETAFVPLNTDSLLPVLLFLPQVGPNVSVFSQAGIGWIPHGVRDLHGDDPAQVKRHLDHYPALRDSTLLASGPIPRLEWRSVGPGLSLSVEWRNGVELGDGTALMLADRKTINGLGVASYQSAEDLVITPNIGSMSAALHPILALWAVLLALSSLARYEPAAWSKMVDIDRSADANAIEHLLDAAIDSVPAAACNLLTC
jgi:YaaC-like Protein